MMKQQGLYYPEYRHDNCSRIYLQPERSDLNDIIHKALQILKTRTLRCCKRRHAQVTACWYFN
jgi:hypothetical protein